MQFPEIEQFIYETLKKRIPPMHKPDNLYHNIKLEMESAVYRWGMEKYLENKSYAAKVCGINRTTFDRLGKRTSKKGLK